MKKDEEEEKKAEEVKVKEEEDKEVKRCENKNDMKHKMTKETKEKRR